MARKRSERINVLFTSVGRRVELLRAFRCAYVALGLGGNIIAIDMDPLAPALQEADKCHVVPPLKSEEFMPALIEICESEHADLIFPLIDPDIIVLAENKELLKKTGADLAVVPLQAARKTNDKWLTHRFLRELDLRTPGSWLPYQLKAVKTAYPLFIKPRIGSAARHTFQVRNESELEFFLDYVPNPIIQEYLPGPEITNDVICDLSGDLLGIVSRERIEVRWGEVAKGKTIKDSRLIHDCTIIAEALPAIGPLTVQCMLREDVPYYTEINARFGGGLPLGIAAGVDSPRWLLAKAAHIEIEIPPIGSYQTGLYLTRFDDSFFLSEADRARIASNQDQRSQD